MNVQNAKEPPLELPFPLQSPKAAQKTVIKKRATIVSFESHESVASSIPSSKLKEKSVKNTIDAKKIIQLLASHIKSTQKKTSPDRRESKISIVNKKLLKPGEKDYPSPFARIWRKHMQEKREDNPVRKSNIPQSSNIPPPKCNLQYLFYWDFNYLFNKGKDLEKKDMRRLAPFLRSQRVLKTAKDIIKKSKDKAKESKKPEDEIIDVSEVVFKMVKSKLKKAVFLKVLENITILMLSMIPKVFLPQIKRPPHRRNNLILIICPFLAGILTILRYILREHSARYICQSRSKAGQTLRALLFNKIQRVNISFLNLADSSLITKLFLFEIEIITEYIAQMPNLLNFPLIFTFSIIFMVYFISWTTLITFVMFIIAWVLLIVVTKKQALSAMREKYFSSKRSVIVQEVLSKLKHVKSGNLETYFELYISQLRDQEVKAIKRINDLKSVANFIMRLTPLFSLLIIMYLEKRQRHKRLGVTSTFTILGIIAAMKKPLNRFVRILDRYYAYHQAKESFNNFFFAIPNKPLKRKPSTKVNLGTLKFINCLTKLESPVEIQKAIDAIFGEVIDAKREINKMRKKLNQKKKSRQEYRKKLDRLASETEDFKNFKSANSMLRGKKNKQNIRQRMRKSIIINSQRVGLLLQKIGQPLSALGKGVIGLTDHFTLEDFTLSSTSKVLAIREDLKRSKIPILKPINLYIKGKSKVALIGDDGSGIKEFIQLLLGETYVTQGERHIRGKIVLLDTLNSVFLNGQSLRDNILMGATMIRSRYDRVIKNAKLNMDSFRGGDMTEVLENGHNFSASERRKILLARMLYVTGDIYILKDFFGHDEDEIEDTLYEDIVMGPLQAKTVLITTNNVDILKKVDKIVCFKHKEVINMGSYKKYKKTLENQALGLKSIITMNGEDDKSPKKSISSPRKKSKSGLLNPRKKRKALSSNFSGKKTLDLVKKVRTIHELSQLKDGRKILELLVPGIIKIQQKKKAGKMADSWCEEKVYHRLMSTMFRYIFSLGKWRIIFNICNYFISMLLFIGIDIWTGCWSNRLFKGFKLYHYMAVYLCLSLTASFFVIVRDMIFTRTIMKNSNDIHDKMVQAMLNMKLRFINMFPTTRIHFKMSYDMRRIDTLINHHISDLLEALVFVLGGMLILNYVYIGTMLITTIIFGIYLKSLIRRFVITTTKIIQYIAENTSSMLNIYKISIEEMRRYRAIGKISLIRNEFQSTTNEMQRAMSHLGFFSKRWLNMRIIIVNTSLIFVAYLIPNIIVFYLQGRFNRSLLEFALAISWSLKIVNYFNTFIRSITNVYTEIVSFGRLEYFLTHYQSEEVGKKKLFSLPQKYSEDSVKMTRVNLTFQGRKVLNDVNLSVVQGDTVSIIGDSGSGKHLLFSLILKLYERDKTSADERDYEIDEDEQRSEILVLGYKMKDVNNRDIRAKISYLSRDSQIVTGSIRENIDPNLNHSDKQIIHLLRVFRAPEVIQNTIKTEIQNTCNQKEYSDVQQSKNSAHGAKNNQMNNETSSGLKSIPKPALGNIGLKKGQSDELTTKHSKYPQGYQD